MTDFITDKSVEMIGQYNQAEDPFFLYVAYTAPHWPLHAPDADIAKYESRYKDGYDKLRKERLQRQIKLGLIPANTQVYEGHPLWPKWDSLTPEQKASEAKRMAVYAAMVDNMDRQIGRVFEYLKASGQLDNTYVFFMSDNGADGNSAYDIGKTREWVAKDLDNSTQNIGRPGSSAEYGPGWAQVGSTPFKSFKAFIYEGGISVPAIFWGPGFKDGTIKRELGHVTDIAPTIYELAGTKHPGTEYKGKAVQPLRGKSMVAYLKGKQAAVHKKDEPIGWELGGRKGLRKGDWKIVYANKPWGEGTWELYNIAKDRTESRNLAAKQPAKLKELLADWQAYVAENGVVELDHLADRPGYSNSKEYYQDVASQAAEKPRRVQAQP
jgi:arylsulfatase